ncbi:MAG: hypothetical protein GY810_22165 [Aureispira sp.]|nr:hypothetical protein [Aureispira sp.]
MALFFQIAMPIAILILIFFILSKHNRSISMLDEQWPLLAKKLNMELIRPDGNLNTINWILAKYYKIEGNLDNIPFVTYMKEYGSTKHRKVGTNIDFKIPASSNTIFKFRRNGFMAQVIDSKEEQIVPTGNEDFDKKYLLISNKESFCKQLASQPEFQSFVSKYFSKTSTEEMLLDKEGIGFGLYLDKEGVLTFSSSFKLESDEDRQNWIKTIQEFLALAKKVQQIQA